MSIRCHYVGDLHPNLTDKWTLNVMDARVWTTYNPNNNRILLNDLITVDERGTRFIVHGMVIAINLEKTGNTYKLVITVRDNEEDIDCVLFNSEATPLLGITVEELFNKTITEGANDPNWIVDYLIDHLCTQWVVP
uniref:Replication protein A 70 kDa DNA-binding subunit B n=1 Tax=Tanacetum cinerariifolium TaxID=118510 RepID=A0A699J790_TANCI|nr:replication protein A 70 kDa DNA-binding subunit B [Tanacetum cinerariifolium]GFA14961.1 replication protein A 70 kDa DNA-binding subunit B [Tanacetum cinerariifolium]